MDILPPKYEVTFRTSEGTYIVKAVRYNTSARDDNGEMILYYTDTDMERIRIPGVIDCSRVTLPEFRKHAVFSKGKTYALLSMCPGDMLRLPLRSKNDRSGWASLCSHYSDSLRDVTTGQRTRQWMTDTVTYPGEILIKCIR